MANTFKSGIHPNDSKELSAKQSIETMPAPKVVYIPLSQHLGKPATAVVEKGATVKAGQLIARADGFISADVFSSVSGTVIDITERPTSTGRAMHIVIENDWQNETVELKALENPSVEQIIERVKECGIVGMGGAGFPTSVKLNTGTTIDTLIINAAECEPYITCDHRIMLDYTEQFMYGVMLLKKAVAATNVVIGIEENKQDAIERLNIYINQMDGDKPSICVLKCKYPQGAERQITYAVTKRKVSMKELPKDVGVVVSNVHTALSTYLAVSKGQPLYRRVMTVSGKGIKNPKNIWVQTGTTYKDIIEYCGGLSDEPTVKMLNGGPMMGFAVDNDSVATTKTTSSLLLLTKDEAFLGKESACINCAKCASVCPMQLMPMYIDMFSLVGDTENAVKYGAKNCIECGSCAYICPAKRPLVQSIRLAKYKKDDKGAK